MYVATVCTLMQQLPELLCSKNMSHIRMAWQWIQVLCLAMRCRQCTLHQTFDLGPYSEVLPGQSTLQNTAEEALSITACAGWQQVTLFGPMPFQAPRSGVAQHRDSAARLHLCSNLCMVVAMHPILRSGMSPYTSAQHTSFSLVGQTDMLGLL